MLNFPDELTEEQFLALAKEAFNTKVDSKYRMNAPISAANMFKGTGFGSDNNALQMAKVLLITVFMFREENRL